MPDSEAPLAERRSDSAQNTAHRKIITDLAALKASVVRSDRFYAVLGAAATVIVSAAWVVTIDAVNRLERGHIENMRAFRDDVQKELDRATVYSKASYAVTVEHRPPGIVAEEVKLAIPDAGVRR